LNLLLGHLRAHNKISTLILIDISALQLLVGSTTLFFNLSLWNYEKWIGNGWLISIWSFLSDLGLAVHISNAFVPPYPGKVLVP
jgi:hypothetical protein